MFLLWHALAIVSVIAISFTMGYWTAQHLKSKDNQ